MKTQILKAIVIVASGLFMVSCDSDPGIIKEWSDVMHPIEQDLPNDPNEEAQKTDSLYKVSDLMLRNDF